jgi:hypothetical protein
LRVARSAEEYRATRRVAAGGEIDRQSSRAYWSEACGAIDV